MSKANRNTFPSTTQGEGRRGRQYHLKTFILATLADLRNQKNRQNHEMLLNAKLITNSCKYIFVWCSMMAIMVGHSDGCMLTTTAKKGSSRQKISVPYLRRPTDLQTQVLTRDVKPNAKYSAEGRPWAPTWDPWGSPRAAQFTQWKPADCTFVCKMMGWSANALKVQKTLRL